MSAGSVPGVKSPACPPPPPPPRAGGRLTTSTDCRCWETSWPSNSLHSNQASLGQAKVRRVGADPGSPWRPAWQPQGLFSAPTARASVPSQGGGATLQDPYSEPLGPPAVWERRGQRARGPCYRRSLLQQRKKSSQEAPPPLTSPPHLSAPTVCPPHKKLHPPPHRPTAGGVTQVSEGMSRERPAQTSLKSARLHPCPLSACPGRGHRSAAGGAGEGGRNVCGGRGGSARQSLCPPPPAHTPIITPRLSPGPASSATTPASGLRSRMQDGSVGVGRPPVPAGAGADCRCPAPAQGPPRRTRPLIPSPPATRSLRRGHCCPSGRQAWPPRGSPPPRAQLPRPLH